MFLLVSAVYCGFLLTQYPSRATVATMLRNLLLAPVAAILAATTLGGWIYVNYFYKGGRRRKGGGHRFSADSVIMMYAEVRPNLADRSTWYQVPISKNLPPLGVA